MHEECAGRVTNWARQAPFVAGQPNCTQTLHWSCNCSRLSRNLGQLLFWHGEETMQWCMGHTENRETVRAREWEETSVHKILKHNTLFKALFIPDIKMLWRTSILNTSTAGLKYIYKKKRKKEKKSTLLTCLQKIEHCKKSWLEWILTNIKKSNNENLSLKNNNHESSLNTD